MILVNQDDSEVIARLGFMRKVEQFITYIQSDNYESGYAEKIVKSLKTEFSETLFSQLRQLFLCTLDHEIRDRIAIAFIDLGDARALEILMLMIKCSKTYLHRGTLVYAVSKFNPANYIYDLVCLAVNDTWETSTEAINAIESITGIIDENEFIKCTDFLSENISKLDGWRKEHAQELFLVFEENVS